MDIGWKLVSGVAAAGAGLVANKAVDASWKGFTGHQSPTDDTEDEFGLGEILAFAILSAVVASVASVLARQVAKKWYKPVPKEDRVAFHNA